MTNNCPSCGKELKEGAKFCQYCGNKIQAQTVPPSPPPQQYQQPPTPQPAPAPMQPKKSKTGLIIGIVAVVVVVVVLLVVMLMFFSGGLNLGGDEGHFNGTWEQTLGTEPYTTTIQLVFNSDKTYEFKSGFITETGTWNIKNSKLVIESDMVGAGFISGEYDYEFSDNQNTLTLSYIGIDVYTFTKQ